jgi:pSer/pThr/pTyr-binding forkhead associated (FHA) protein
MSTASPAYVKVSVTFNGKLLNTFTFDRQDILIGRGSDCDVMLENPGASRHHARLVRVGNAVEVHDLESGNGTFINGKQITKAVVGGNDSIGISKYTLTVSLTDSGTPIGNGPRDDDAPPQDEGHTVFLKPAEASRVGQQATGTRAPAARITKVEDATPEKKSPLAMMVIGAIIVGVLIGWILRGLS